METLLRIPVAPSRNIYQTPKQHALPKRIEFRAEERHFTEIVKGQPPIFKADSMNLQGYVSVSSLLLNKIAFHNKELALIRPIAATIIANEQGCTMRNEELDIITSSSTIENCINEFNDEVLFVWEEYGKEDDDKLTDGAKRLKKEILRYIIG